MTPPFSRRSNLVDYRSQKLKITHKGMSFASKAEASLYDLLEARKLSGEVQNIQCQDHVYLTQARIQYRPDFKFAELFKGEWRHAWAEMKGYETDVWRIKRKLWLAGYGPGTLYVYKPSSRGPRLYETLVPRAINQE